MWEQMTADIRAHGGEVRLNAPVTKLRVSDGRVTEVIAGGETLRPSHVISSLPLRTTVGITEPEAPLEVRDAARGLRYREFLTVLLVIDGDDLFPDNWIYIHQPGRARAADPELQVLEPVDGARGRDRRLDRDGVLLLRGRRAVEHGGRRPGRDGRPGDREAAPGEGRARSSSASSSASTRPIRSTTSSTPSASRRSAAGWRRSANLAQVGRNGLHRYNNSDHSMLTAMRAVDNILLGTHHDIWAVNAESVYHEEHQENEDPYRNPPTDARDGAAARVGALSRRAVARA